MIAIADASDMPLVPWWVFIAAATLVAALIWAADTYNAAAAPEPTAPVQRRATNPDCATQGHVKTWFGDNTAWACARNECTEPWPAPHRATYDQEATS